jgi:histidine triad (HIT) family protein
MTNCIFCKIVAGQIPAQLVLETPDAVAFKDTNPQAPHHYLVVPRKHVPAIRDLVEDDRAIAGSLLLAARDVAKGAGLDSYRLVVNTGPDAGQTVYHIHVHVLGGRGFDWPPG